MASISNNGGRSSKPASAMEVEHTQPLTVPVQLVAVGQRPASQELPTPTSVEHNNQHPSVMLEIDDQERKVFETLNAVVRRLSEDGSQFSIPDRPQVKHIQVRIAGGWVRDKLLGLETHDIDIALDTCSGVEFATLVQTYMESEHTNHEEERRHSKIGIIAANPTQSKHLETATMRIMGLEVDFSNLRHEQYSSDSRIPTTVLGTPLEDAFRRDFTINTLFFNLSTMCLEDWTHRAFVDLKQGIVSTPLEAYQTFQ
jgi:tRNA nucleotidyltransferase (CCA-adding enzyme)